MTRRLSGVHREGVRPALRLGFFHGNDYSFAPAFAATPNLALRSTLSPARFKSSAEALSTAWHSAFRRYMQTVPPVI